MTAITEHLAALKAGELVAIPTETVYGLAADASNPEAVRKIFALKGRPPSRPLIVHIPSIAAMDEWAQNIPDYARRWGEVFWPGPLAMVFPRTDRVLDAVTGGQDSVALRIPNHSRALELLQAFGGGLAAPSANRYGRISPTRAEHVAREFGDQAPLVLDGGPCQVGIESTIVSCLDTIPVVLRPGAITAVALAEVGGVEVASDGTKTDVVVPGQVASHYAPVTPARLLPHNQAAQWAAPQGRLGFLGFNAPHFEVALETLMASTPEAAAREVYAALRTLDEAQLDHILIEAPPADPAWAGVRDRLQRAAA